MARRRKKLPMNNSTLVAIIMVSLVLVIGVVGCLIDPISNLLSGLGSGGSGASGGSGSLAATDGEVVVHFVDVGQGDCTLICTSKGNIIIDAGTNSSEDEMKAYIDKLGIKSFEYAIFTHPHEDHIGGAEVIMRNYEVANVIISDLAATTNVYEIMLDSIEQSSADVTVIEAGMNFEFSVGSLSAKILGPVEIDDDPNNASIVTKISYGKTSLLLMGDAEEGSEKLLLKKYGFSGQLKADIIKLGHHGSSTSSSLDFIRAVSPDVAIISCGIDNKYRHPHAETTEMLKAENIEYHRTDKEGSIIYIINADGYSHKQE